MRLDAGLTQRRLALLAEIDHGFLSLIERGLREPSLACSRRSPQRSAAM
jgi:transcriptional regulator with XRE-family HTH domain